jgi:molybdenum cofactor cytidylyltransferase
MLAAVILSGGQSSRMGSPKALLRFQGKTFLEHLVAVTTHAQISVRRIVLGSDAGLITQAVALHPSDIVSNPDWPLGQLSSIHSALRSLPPGTDGILLCLVDHPLVSGELVDQLITVFYATRKSIVLPVCDGRRGHPVIFSAKLYEELLAAPVDQGARAVVWAHTQDLVEVPTSDQGCLWLIARRAMSRGVNPQVHPKLPRRSWRAGCREWLPANAP